MALSVLISGQVGLSSAFLDDLAWTTVAVLLSSSSNVVCTRRRDVIVSVPLVGVAE